MIAPLSYHAYRLLAPTDSMTVEQQFMSYIFYDDNWQSLRLFPHRQADGSVVWYAPADELPASLGAEHQKYIREVFPRMQREVEAGNWAAVDAYIDRLLQYQCTFGSTTAAQNSIPVSSTEGQSSTLAKQGLSASAALLSILLIPLLVFKKKAFKRHSP